MTRPRGNPLGLGGPRVRRSCYDEQTHGPVQRPQHAVDVFVAHRREDERQDVASLLVEKGGERGGTGGVVCGVESDLAPVPQPPNIETAGPGDSRETADDRRRRRGEAPSVEQLEQPEQLERADNPDATAFIFYGDGKGNFRKTVFATGMGFHEARVADLNGDGLPGILSKPYNWETPRLDIWLQKKGGEGR
jgi:hypothetical protein